MTRSFSNQTFRFAPSSNGLLHLGHAYSAALNFELAQATGGRMLLRIENIDAERCRAEFEQAIYDDLHWLGLSWELPARRQSEHFADYANALERLRALGAAYPCFCSRGEIMAAVASKPDWPRDPDGSPLYPGLCKHLSPAERARRLASGRSAATRIDMAAALAHVGFQLDWLERSPQGMGASRRQATPAIWGDAIIARRDIKTSYHIAVVTDDALQGVTDVVRGEDLFMATHLHRLLQTLLDLPAPTYRHHRLLRDASGQKLSKSLRAKSLRALRQEGLSPQAARESLKIEATAG
ncbi:tRNA glutamyl-Q(34) synthetase GluQRS [Methylocella silvestris]|uniref:tRNA glutamyl-Q(34) synthetase GluQRS n=1 Tax=Methylocella silvestris TaxID=199596 RepID=A0A2J7TL66_METSI|nr:tRNA glutamyl-Q(34) synthetase GluQRS [Methylocella silvestris]PNG27499.1 tRNA glutamyl-Q(34) synthetase GluQRS [Methylocella silvestris]